MSSVPPFDSWFAAGREAAALARAYVLSSGRANHRQPTAAHGWVISPDGEILAVTSTEQPFASLTIDLKGSQARSTDQM